MVLAKDLYRQGFTNLWNRHPNMDSLVAPASDFESVTGQGVHGLVNQHQIAIGNEQVMKSLDLSVASFKDQAQSLSSQGKTVMYIAIDRELVGIVAVADPLKDTSVQAIAAMQAMGLEVLMVTGDKEETAQAIAQEVGIERVIAEVLPEDKAQVVAQLQEEGKHVLMVGDGINDAPALTLADVGLAVGSGTDIAIESADTVLMHDNLEDVVESIHLSNATTKNIRQNLFWAFTYNVIGLPVAMGILKLVFDCPLLNPMAAALAMSLSFVSVLLNALRLRNY